jgi:N-methylhydantoinase B/oxoprolinase/acetone carboxylase alpha subunit
MAPGQRLRIETPGGGGYGEPPRQDGSSSGITATGTLP